MKFFEFPKNKNTRNNAFKSWTDISNFTNKSKTNTEIEIFDVKSSEYPNSVNVPK